VRITDYALAPDGGIQIVTLEIDDGQQLSIGLDGRMDSPAAGMQLFIGNGPEAPDASMLQIGGAEEAEIIALLERWLEKTQSYIRRESLMDADISKLKGQSLRDRLAIEFLLEIQQRNID
jgi:hypothetical protein